MVNLKISAIGARGDGIAIHEGDPVFVPFALPGDSVEAEILAQGKNKPSRARVTGHEKSATAHQPPPCRHFEVCGGCIAQHMREDVYAAWKRDRIVGALAHRGIATDQVDQIRLVSPGTRRRAALAFSVEKNRTTLGFRRLRGREIVDIEACPVLLPELFQLVQTLRHNLPEFLPDGAEGQVKILKTDSGIDLSIDTKIGLDLKVREALAALSTDLDLARVTFADELVSEQRKPCRTFGGIAVELPPFAFLQPTEAGEEFLIEAVINGITDLKMDKALVADLFSGCGTFSGPVSGFASVHAYDQDALAVSALERSASRAGAAVTSRLRDLFDDPLTARDLDRYDAVIFDPPRAGARAQSAELANADVGRIMAVSCNPGTFARDARILIDGGFTLDWVKPLDQFLWSSEVELVASFTR